MKIRSFFLSILCLMAVGTMFSACEEENDNGDNDGTPVVLPKGRAFILNEGIYIFKVSQS